ncbi:hypothetical protein CR513_10385, partial [Mucuna pruriens]
MLNEMCTRYQKSKSQHKYAMHLKSKAMESKMTQMFQMLTQTNAAIMALVNQNVAEYVEVGHVVGPSPAMSEIHLMGCRRGGTPKTLPTRSKNSRTL